MWTPSRREQVALGCVVALALQGGGFCKSAELAARVGSTPAFVEQVLLRLRRAGVVRARRGPRGGVQLAVAPAQLNVLEVLRALPSGRRQVPSSVGTPAQAAQAWVAEVAREALESALSALTVAALCARVDRDAAARAHASISFEI